MENEVIRALDNWARYIHINGSKLGFPVKSHVFCTGGSSTEDSFQIICDGLDYHSAEIMDTLIYDLPRYQRQSIYHKWLGSIKPPSFELQLQLAGQVLFRKMAKRGLF